MRLKPDHIFRAALAAAPLAPLAQPGCPEWTDPHTQTVTANPSQDLSALVRNAPAHSSLLLEPGLYRVSAALQFTRPGVTLRSRTGRREDAVLDGSVSGGSNPSGFTNEIIAVSASEITVADLSIRHARDHAVHAYAPSTGNIQGLRLRNLHVSDCGQQLIKVNSNGGNPLYWVDSGLVECSWIGFVDNSVMEPMSGGFYTGGIDIHGGRGWVIRGNVFRNIQREGRSMEHAVHLWSKSRGCMVEANRFEDVYRAIGLGMKTSATGLVRSYEDGRGDNPYLDYLEGVVRNNVIFNRAGIRLESGIEIMNVQDTEVYHNTVHSADPAFSSIEYRWPDTRVILKNNLVRQTLLRRDNAQAALEGNLENAPAALYADAAAGDLHLAAGASAAIDKGVSLAAGKADHDIDGQARGAQPDIGADEFGAGAALRRAGADRRTARPAEWIWKRRATPLAVSGEKAPAAADGRRRETRAGKAANP